jgi:CopG family nickel-responsive transcriptional regulator
MGEAVRFSASLSEDLLKALDNYLDQKGYKNRSEGLRDIIRDNLVKQEVIANRDVVGVLTIVYDHHVRELTQTIIEEQHNSSADVISSMHVHLDHHNCLEIIVVKGKGAVIQKFSDRIIGTRGVKHGNLSITSTGKDLPR